MLPQNCLLTFIWFQLKHYQTKSVFQFMTLLLFWAVLHSHYFVSYRVYNLSIFLPFVVDSLMLSTKTSLFFALSLFCRNFFIKSMSCFWTPMQEISLNRSWWTSQLVYICKFTVLFQIFTDSIMEMKGIRPKNIEEKPKRIDSTSFKKLSIFPFYRIHRHICSLLQVCQANT